MYTNFTLISCIWGLVLGGKDYIIYMCNCLIVNIIILCVNRYICISIYILHIYIDVLYIYISYIYI